jgi:hypothetical protein
MEERADRALARTQRKEQRMNTTTTKWERPRFEQPMLFDGHRMTLLGTDRRGRYWWSDPKYGELVERGVVDATREVLPSLPIARVDGADGDLYMSFEVMAPGSFEAAMAIVPRKPKPEPDHRPVDVVAATHLGARVPERITAITPPRVSADPNPLSPVATPPIIKPAEEAPRGAAAIIDRLASKKANVSLAADVEHLVVTCEDGRPAAGVVELVEKSAPLIVAWLQGTPLTCVVSQHAEPVEAVTIAFYDTPWCGSCTP